MNEPGSITRCIRDFKDGNVDSAQHQWERCYKRLVGLARKKLGDLPRKCANERAHQFRAKRGSGKVRNQAVSSDLDDALSQVIGKDPTPLFAGICRT